MKCSDLNENLSLYLDAYPGDELSAAIDDHLAQCPLCRQRLTELSRVRTDLRRLPRSPMPEALNARLKRSVAVETSRSRRSGLSVSPDLSDWFAMRVMPYGIGVFASLAIGVTFLTMMFSGRFYSDAHSVAASGESSVMLASNSDPYGNIGTERISPSDYARTRLAFANESPSVNPQGALIALTRSFIRGGPNDDEVVVVADVFGNGLAHIAEVVEPSRDRRAVDELEKALGSDPAYAPFVPADMDKRVESVRVVLKFQSVNVPTGLKTNKRRR